MDTYASGIIKRTKFYEGTDSLILLKKIELNLGMAMIADDIIRIPESKAPKHLNNNPKK